MIPRRNHSCLIGFLVSILTGFGHASASASVPRVLAEWAVSPDREHQVGAHAVAVTPRGELVVPTSKGTIAIYTPEGEGVREWAPKEGGPLRAAMGVAVDRTGRIYVSEYYGHRIRVFTPEGKLIRSWGGKGARPGQLDGPSGIAVDTRGLVYVVDRGNRRIQVFTPDGRFQFSWKGDGKGQLEDPVAIAVDGDRVYVGDAGKGSVKIFDRRGRFLTQWGPGPGMAPPIKMVTQGRDRAGVGYAIGIPAPLTPDRIPELCESSIEQPFGIALDPSGVVYVLNGQCHRVQKFSRSGRYLGGWWIGDPPRVFGQSAAGLAVRPDGEVCVADYDGHIWIFGYGPTRDEGLVARVLGPEFHEAVLVMSSLPIGTVGPAPAERLLSGGSVHVRRDFIGFDRKPVLRSAVWTKSIEAPDPNLKPRLERALAGLNAVWQKSGIELLSRVSQSSDHYRVELERTSAAIRSAVSKPDTCDLRVLEGSLQEAAGVWGTVTPALHSRWPELARSLTGQPEDLDELLRNLQAATKPDVTEPDRDLAFLAVDQWLRSRPGPYEVLGPEWNRLGFRTVGMDYPGPTYCGSALPELASHAGLGNKWADRAFIVLLDLGWSTDCSDVYEGAQFGNEIFYPILNHGEDFLTRHPGSNIWPSVALRVALAHETAWSLGFEAPPDDFPDYRKGYREHGRRALALYRKLVPLTKDDRLIRALRRKIQNLEQGRDTKCQVYYLTGEC